MELSELCGELRNWFETIIFIDEFTVKNGVIDMPEGALQEGQYFRIVGSVFNDGVYQYPASGLHDETFDGAVWAMAVPQEVLRIKDDIDAWQEKYGDSMYSPYQSESFGGYSYSKGTATDGTSSGDWKNVFKGRLKRWRKL